VRPNHLWHLDFVQRYIGKVSTFTLILIDDCSRYVVGHGVDDAERADMVVGTFEEATERHGRPERVMHDFATHEAKALYVLDSSIFPTNLGVNPQHSIMAMARLGATRVASDASRSAAA